jgi:uncharacterized protein HemX
VKLSDLNPQTQAARIVAGIVGLLLVLALWAAPAVGVYLYLAGQQAIAVKAAEDTTRAQVTAEFTNAAAEAVAKARADWAKRQAEATRQAEEDRAAIARDLAGQRTRAENLLRQLLGHINANPLPADCRLDADRVRLYSDSRRRGPAPTD